MCFEAYHAEHWVTFFDQTSTSNKDGYACIIELYQENGKVNRITLTSDYYVVDDNCYKCDIDYFDEFQKVYKQITEQYFMNMENVMK